MERTIKNILANLSLAFLLTGTATVIGFVFRFWNLQETNIVIIYILSVVLTARFSSGYFYGIGATVLSFLLFNWFFTEPYYSLKINDPTLILTAVIMFITATITSALTSKVKQTAMDAREKEAESNALYQMTNHLTDAETNDQIAAILVQTISRILCCNAGFVGFDDTDTPTSYCIQQKEDGSQIHRKLDDPVAFQKRMRNLHAPYEIGKEFYEYPIYGRTNLLGVLRIPCACGADLTEAQTRVMHAAMESTSLALDRLRSFQDQAKVQEEAAQERYRSNLLRAISHDLRTPLSGIMGNSEILMGMTEKTDPRYNLSKDIYEDADWLHSLVENILSLTRFQDQRLALKKEPEAVEEVIGAALVVLEKRMPTRDIDVEIPDTLLMVPMDARLITQVLVNLLDNAAKHTPSDQEIKVSVTVSGEQQLVFFSVADRGCGIPQKALPQIFQMFYTTSKQEASSKRGIGIGLPICQSIIEAHGGKIWAENRDGGGAKFTFTLPLGGDAV